MKLKPFFPTCKLICPKQLITFHTCSSTVCEKGYKSKKINGEGKTQKNELMVIKTEVITG